MTMMMMWSGARARGEKVAMRAEAWPWAGMHERMWVVGGCVGKLHHLGTHGSVMAHGAVRLSELSPRVTVSSNRAFSARSPRPSPPTRGRRTGHPSRFWRSKAHTAKRGHGDESRPICGVARRPDPPKHPREARRTCCSRLGSPRMPGLLGSRSGRGLWPFPRGAQGVRAHEREARLPIPLTANRAPPDCSQRQRVLPLRQCSFTAKSWINQLGTWSSVEACNVLTLRADPKVLKLVQPATVPPWRGGPSPMLVSRMSDVSGHGHDASVHALRPDRRPTFEPDALGEGIGAVVFNGGQVIETAPFATPLPQPLSIMVVARCNGDTTLCDSLSSSSPRFELCHGYPSNANVNAQPGSPAICMSAHGVGADAPTKLLRGTTRATNAWHVYTAVFDGDRSEMYVDGVREAGGRSIGSSSLDGLRIGCDHTSTFFLRGAIAELRIYSCHLSDGPRAQIEAALALRYGLKPAPPPEFAARPAKPRRKWSF